MGPLATPPPTRPRKTRTRLYVSLAIAAVLVVTLAALTLIPFPQTKINQTQIAISAPKPGWPAYGQSSAETFPSGTTVQVSWTTLPPIGIALTEIGLDGQAGRFLGEGSSGSSMFSSTGGAYAFNVSYWGSVNVVVAVSASYSASAPLL